MSVALWLIVSLVAINGLAIGLLLFIAHQREAATARRGAASPAVRRRHGARRLAVGGDSAAMAKRVTQA